jgi:Fe-S cluster biogenesis protein NfuA
MSMGMSDGEELSYDDAWDRIAELAEDLMNHHDVSVAQRVEELLDWVDAVHKEGLGQLVEMIRAWRGEVFLENVAREPVPGRLLAAYGLGITPEELGEEARKAVDAALAEIAPLVESHGGAIEVVDVADGVVKVRMHGTCDGCASSSATLTYGLEAELKKRWPDFRRLEEVDAATEVNPDTVDLESFGPSGAASAVPEPQQPLIQIKGHEGR